MKMTSNCDVTKSAHQIQMTTIWPWTNPSMKNFCICHWPPLGSFVCLCSGTDWFLIRRIFVRTHRSGAVRAGGRAPQLPDRGAGEPQLPVILANYSHCECIVGSFVVSIYFGKLAIVWVALLNPHLIVNIFSRQVRNYSGKVCCRPVLYPFTVQLWSSQFPKDTIRYNLIRSPRLKHPVYHSSELPNQNSTPYANEKSSHLAKSTVSIVIVQWFYSMSNRLQQC